MAALPNEARGCLLHPTQPKVYFFAGDRYWRYDLKRDYGEVRYPLPLNLWHLTGSFANGIDAAVDAKGSSPPKSYFFKGDRYVRYDWNGDTVDIGPESIGAWHLAIEGFAAGVDAAFNGEGGFAGNTYFFKRDKYVRYNWNTDSIDVGPAPISLWNLGPGFESEITACCNVVRSGRPKTYFFKKGRYVRYDWGRERADPGYPLPTSAGWPSGLAVWAEHMGAPLLTCADARLEAGENRLLAYPDGTPKGQAGWQLGVKFTNPAKLADMLEGAKIPAFYGDDDADSGTIAPGSITRLGIIAHGLPGVLDTTADQLDLGSRLSSFTVGFEPLRTNLERIGRMLEPGAPIVLLGCNCAREPVGDNLLEALSRIWPGHPVSGFTRIGYADSGKQRRPGEHCDNPGLRVTEQTEVFSHIPSIEQREEDRVFGPDWENLAKLPWGHENLPRHRKTALDGGVVDAHD